MSRVLMWSGGLDSTIAWFALEKPKAVFVHLGHRYCASEMFAVEALTKRLGVECVVEKRLYLGDCEHPDAYIPMRNLFLAMIGALYGSEIYMVFQRGEQSLPDRSHKFLRQASKLLSFLNGRVVEVKSVFARVTKAQMIRWYLASGFPVDVLYRTVSCFSADPMLIPCGRCAACFRRWVAFECNDLSISFHFPITEWEGIEEYVRKIKEGKYESRRAKETITVLKKYGLWRE